MECRENAFDRGRLIGEVSSNPALTVPAGRDFLPSAPAFSRGRPLLAWEPGGADNPRGRYLLRLLLRGLNGRFPLCERMGAGFTIVAPRAMPGGQMVTSTLCPLISRHSCRVSDTPLACVGRTYFVNTILCGRQVPDHKIARVIFAWSN